MKVILLNGSPNEFGTTRFALDAVADTLAKHGVDSEVITIGGYTIRGCTGCQACFELKYCVNSDELNSIAEKIHAADGLVVGSPVYYAGINGTLKAFLDRLFYSGTGKFRFKPAAAVVAMRRAGGTAARATINHYFEFAEMLITPTHYWSGIHGLNAEQAEQDAEGIQQMQVIGRNMAFLLEMKAKSDLPIPEPVQRIKTNFVR
jgi:multimeric flavodoxin WrbA